MKKMRLLIVDDEPALCKVLSDRITVLHGITPDVSHNGLDALEKIKAADYDVVVLDIEMPGLDGMETLKRIKELRPTVQVIMFTGHSTEERRALAETLGAFNYVDKIDGISTLSPTITSAFKFRKALEDAYADIALNEYSR